MTNNEWTKDEQDLLILLAKRGKKQAAIAKELGRTERAVNSQIYRLRKGGKLKHWLDYEHAIILDVETTDFSADIGIMLSWAIKPVGGKVISDVITREELFNGQLDRRICRSLVAELEKADAVITYFGTGFDSQKSPVDISVWQKARWGDKNALGYVLEHNELDVHVLEEVYNKLRDFVKVTRKSI